MVPVTWTLSPIGAASGTIVAATGLYTPPATVPTPPTVTVTATPAFGLASSTTITLTAPADTSLVGYWNFDGNGASTNWSGAAGPVATLAGALPAVFTSTAAEVHAGQAIKATGAGSYGSFDNPTDLTQFTISFWGRCVDNNWSTNTQLSRFIDATDNLLIYPNTSNKALYFAAKYSGGNRQFKTGDNVFQPGTMYHIVIAWDSSNPTNLPVCYLNGTLAPVSVDGSNSGSGTHISNACTWYLLNRLDRTRTINGSIDDLRIYNRVLTPAEIIALP